MSSRKKGAANGEGREREKRWRTDKWRREKALLLRVEQEMIDVSSLC